MKACVQFTFVEPDHFLFDTRVYLSVESDYLQFPLQEISLERGTEGQLYYVEGSGKVLFGQGLLN